MRNSVCNDHSLLQTLTPCSKRSAVGAVDMLRLARSRQGHHRACQILTESSRDSRSMAISLARSATARVIECGIAEDKGDGRGQSRSGSRARTFLVVGARIERLAGLVHGDGSHEGRVPEEGGARVGLEVPHLELRVGATRVQRRVTDRQTWGARKQRTV